MQANRTAGLTATAYPTLFSPLSIRGLEVRNRLFMPPHTTNFADGVSTDRLTAYYRARAQGGVGLIVHEGVLVHPSSIYPHRIWGWELDNLPLLRATTDAVHEHGAKIVCQLSHKGPQMSSHLSHVPTWAASDVPGIGAESSHAMFDYEIEELVEAFASTTSLCLDAGFDGVEIHGAHGYLLHSFLSPLSNRRTDEYGGNEENRLRLLLRVLAAARVVAGDGPVVGVRLSGDEFQEGGLTAEDMQRIARRVETDVDIDYISISAGQYGSYDRIVPDMSYERGLNVPLATNIRRGLTSCPVLVAGRIDDASHAEEILASHRADMIGMARALIADPDWPRKVQGGKGPSIRPCIFANECRGCIGAHRPLTCAVNPVAGREREAIPSPTHAKRRLTVVGGGVAGMECAVSAARLGHAVTLIERDELLGGQVRLAASLESRSELARIVAHLERALHETGVDVQCGHAATRESLLADPPDVLVLATGARPRPIRTRGIDGAIRAWDILDGAPMPEGQVVVYDEGGRGWSFCETVELLALQGRRVVAVTPAATIVGPDIDQASVPPLYRRLFAKAVTLATNHRLISADDGAATIRHVYTGAESIIRDVASVVIETGTASESWLYDDLRGSAFAIELIGDAQSPRRIGDAIREGRRAARRLGDLQHEGTR